MVMRWRRHKTKKGLLIWEATALYERRENSERREAIADWAEKQQTPEGRQLNSWQRETANECFIRALVLRVISGEVGTSHKHWLPPGGSLISASALPYRRLCKGKVRRLVSEVTGFNGTFYATCARLELVKSPEVTLCG